MKQRDPKRSNALKFVLLVEVMSLFADFTYEGSRSIIGLYLALLGAGALAVGAVSGFGELLGYGLRLVSGRLSDRTRQFWPITIAGYVLQMSVVPLLALAGNWQVAALLIVLERVGKATRNPPCDVMLSHAAKEIGFAAIGGLYTVSVGPWSRSRWSPSWPPSRSSCASHDSATRIARLLERGAGVHAPCSVLIVRRESASEA